MSIVPEPLTQFPWRVIGILLAIAGFGTLVLYSAAGGSITPWAINQAVRFVVFSGMALVLSRIPLELFARFAFPAYAPIDAGDRLSARPDAAAPIYPVISMSAPLAHAGSRRNLIGENAGMALERAHSPPLHVPTEAPPCFLVHAEDDASVPVGNSLLLREALRARNVPVETHLFPDGGHGFGLRLARGHSVERWPDLFIAWAIRQGMWT